MRTWSSSHPTSDRSPSPIDDRSTVRSPTRCCSGFCVVDTTWTRRGLLARLVVDSSPEVLRRRSGPARSVSCQCWTITLTMLSTTLSTAMTSAPIGSHHHRTASGSTATTASSASAPSWLARANNGARTTNAPHGAEVSAASTSRCGPWANTIGSSSTWGSGTPANDWRRGVAKVWRCNSSATDRSIASMVNSASLEPAVSTRTLTRPVIRWNSSWSIERLWIRSTGTVRRSFRTTPLVTTSSPSCSWNV